MRRRLLARTLALTIASTVAACGGDGSSSGFDADRAPIAPELAAALGEGVDPDEVPEVQRNFLEHCVLGGGEALPDLPAVQRNGLVAVCGCVYDDLVASTLDAAEGATPEVRDENAFAAFEKIEEDLRIEGTLPLEIVELARSCVRSEAGL